VDWPATGWAITAAANAKVIAVNKAYQCQQGQNENMIIIEITLLAALSWATWKPG
jgi:hypothetical protein